MLDELVNFSFDLDYRILQTTSLGRCKQFMHRLEYPRFESDDIFCEYERLITTAKEVISEILSLLTTCDEQRKVILPNIELSHNVNKTYQR